MRSCRGAFLLVLFAVGLSLAAHVAAAGEKCQSVSLHVGEQVSYDPGMCPYPYEGNAEPTAELGCYVAPVVGALNGTWIYYWPAPDNCIYIASEDMVGSGWREDKQLWACWALSVFKTRRGDVFAEAGEMTHSDAFSMPPLAFIDLEIITGGTGHYRGATGWIGGAADEVNGGLFTGQICTAGDGKPHKKGKRRR